MLQSGFIRFDHGGVRRQRRLKRLARLLAVRCCRVVILIHGDGGIQRLRQRLAQRFRGSHKIRGGLHRLRLFYHRPQRCLSGVVGIIRPDDLVSRVGFGCNALAIHKPNIVCPAQGIRPSGGGFQRIVLRIPIADALGKHRNGGGTARHFQIDIFEQHIRNMMFLAIFDGVVLRVQPDQHHLMNVIPAFLAVWMIHRIGKADVFKGQIADAAQFFGVTGVGDRHPVAVADTHKQRIVHIVHIHAFKPDAFYV